MLQGTEKSRVLFSARYACQYITITLFFYRGYKTLLVGGRSYTLVNILLLLYFFYRECKTLLVGGRSYTLVNISPLLYFFYRECKTLLVSGRSLYMVADDVYVDNYCQCEHGIFHILPISLYFSTICVTHQ